MERDQTLIRDKLSFYKDRKNSVHIVVGPPYSFRNGEIMELSEESFIFKDEKLGEIIVFLREVVSVDKREDKR